MNLRAAITRLWGLGLVLILLSGCSTFEVEPCVAPVCSRVNVPENWKESRSLTSVAPLASEWWVMFNDDSLTCLIEEALKNEPNIRQACARVEEFCAKTEVARSRIFPRVDFVPGINHEKISETDTPFGIPAAVIKDDSFTRYQAPFRVSYSLDLFGRMKPMGKAIKCEEAAARADLEAAGLVVSGEVARAYYLFQTLQAEVYILSNALEDRSETIEIQKSLVDAGEQNEQEYAQARLEAAKVEAELALARGDVKEATNALARLTGVAPADFCKPSFRSLSNPPPIPSGVPAEVICRRPDIAAAKRNMMAGLRRTEAEQLSYLPIIELTGAGGLASAQLGSIANAESIAWSIGASLTKTIFDGGEKSFREKVRYAQYKQLVAEYDKTVLDALKEVEDSLSRIQTLNERLRAIQKAKGAAQDLREIAKAQFGRGLTTYLSVIDSQRSLLSIQRAENQLRGALNDATIQLIVALGGGC